MQQSGEFNDDRIAVNINHEIPDTGGMTVLWDGCALLAERGKVVPWTDSTRLRADLGNLAREPTSCPTDEAHIIGTVLLDRRKGGRLLAHRCHCITLVLALGF